MNELELLEEVVSELEEAEQKELEDQEIFRDRYDLLVDCAIDELNDEILKLKLNDIAKTGRLILVKDGKHDVYKGAILSSYNFIGGEEFKLNRVMRSEKGGATLIDYVFEPLQPSPYHYLVLPYNKAIDYMDGQFAQMVAHYLLPAMKSIEEDILKLQHEFADRHRDREIHLLGDNKAVYSEENSW